MNKKGFTILELVTVVALLSIVGIIILPKITTVFNTSKADQMESVRDTVAKSIDIYLNNTCGKNSYNNLTLKKSEVIYLKDVISCGLLEEKVFNTNNNEYYDIKDDSVLLYIDSDNIVQYKFSF